MAISIAKIMARMAIIIAINGHESLACMAMVIAIMAMSIAMIMASMAMIIAMYGHCHWPFMAHLLLPLLFAIYGHYYWHNGH